jgi:hypothetical protein
MNIRFQIKGLKEVSDFINRLPRGVRIVFMRAYTTYILGDDTHGLRHAPPYKYVSRKQAGYAPMSDRMRGWFWANGGPDMIGDNRTGAISEGWQMRETDSSWTHVSITNTAEGAGWVMGTAQARQPAKVGWRKYMNVIKDNMAGGMRSGLAAVRAFIASRGRNV